MVGFVLALLITLSYCYTHDLSPAHAHIYTLLHKQCSYTTKASEFFDPFQLGVACPAGAEKLVHGLWRGISEHWEDDDFIACKVDLRNAFNEVSRQALLEECATHFPELFRWVFWCYGQHPTLWHPMGTLGSEQGS